MGHGRRIRRSLFASVGLLLALALAACAGPQSDWDYANDAGVVADSGFRPETDGFAFANYSVGPNRVEFSDGDVRELLGSQACTDDDPQTECELDPRAIAFRGDAQTLSQGGVCEGLSVLSLLFYSGAADPSQFGAERTPELQLQNNPELEREILRWNATQLTDETINSLRRMSPSQVLATLEDAWAEPGGPLYTLGLYNRVEQDLKNGHAVVPYQIESLGNNEALLYIYNSNKPKTPQTIRIDTEAETWRYQGSNVSYDGSADLELAPVSPRLASALSPRIFADFRNAAQDAAWACA